MRYAHITTSSSMYMHNVPAMEASQRTTERETCITPFQPHRVKPWQVLERGREREREYMTPCQPHRADAGAARNSPGESQKQIKSHTTPKATEVKKTPLHRQGRGRRTTPPQRHGNGGSRKRGSKRREECTMCMLHVRSRRLSGPMLGCS